MGVRDKGELLTKNDAIGMRAAINTDHHPKQST
jgi:hypothetical protein